MIRSDFVYVGTALTGAVIAVFLVCAAVSVIWPARALDFAMAWLYGGDPRAANKTGMDIFLYVLSIVAIIELFASALFVLFYHWICGLGARYLHRSRIQRAVRGSVGRAIVKM